MKLYIKQEKKIPSDWLKVFKSYSYGAPLALYMRAFKDLGLDLYSEIENIGFTESGGALLGSTGGVLQSITGNNNN